MFETMFQCLLYTFDKYLIVFNTVTTNQVMIYYSFKCLGQERLTGLP